MGFINQRIMSISRSLVLNWAAAFFLTLLSTETTLAESRSLQCTSDQEEVSAETSNGKTLWCEKDQKKNGPLLSLFPSGHLRSEARYVNDLREGPYREYSESGELLIEGAYQAGKMSGTWTRWRADQTLIDRGDWSQDAPTGFWRRYDEAENLREEGNYESGSPICQWNLYDGAGGLERKDHGSSHADCGHLSPTPRLRFMRKSVNPLRFSLFGTLIDQDSGGFSSTLFFGIIPQGKISRHFDWLLPVSAGFLRTRTPGQSFSLMLDISGGLRYWVPGVEWLSLEVTLGTQTWTNSGTSFAHSLGLSIDPGLMGILFKFQTKQLENRDIHSSETSIGIEFGLDPLAQLFKSKTP